MRNESARPDRAPFIPPAVTAHPSLTEVTLQVVISPGREGPVAFSSDEKPLTDISSDIPLV
jgi:hypothetical protein